MKLQDKTHLFPPTELAVVKFCYDNELENCDTFISDNVGFFICTQGSMDVEISQRKYSIKERFMFFYFPNMLVRITNVSKDLEGYLAMSNNYSRILTIVNKTLPLNTQLQLRDRPYRKINNEQLEYATHLLNSLIQELALLKNLDSNDIKQKIFVEAVNSYTEYCAYKILYIFIGNEPITSQIADRKELIVQNFILSLLRKFKGQRKVTSYAAEQYLTQNYFSAIIKEKTNKTASEWIAQTTMSYIENALKYSDDSIKELSAELNFPNQSFFGKYFKQRKGMSPLEYRKLMKK